MASIERPGTETPRERVLSDLELKDVWLKAAELGWPFGSATQLLILTGARRGEISGLKWSEIHGDAINLDRHRTKNRVPHIIPLSAPARAILACLPKVKGSDWVFSSTGESACSGWSKARSKLGDKGWTLHDLRRTTATGLQRLGTPLQVTEAVLNHTSGSRKGVVDSWRRPWTCEVWESSGLPT
jgi:integrase